MILETLCLLVCGSHAANLQIEGMLTFELKLPGHVDQLHARPAPEDSGSNENTSRVTAAPVMECIYQYPEKKQVDAILSNMMNVLTKVFVKTHDFFTNKDLRRADVDEGVRQQDSRFKVVDHKNTQFFEQIYHNMTHEFSEFFKETEERMARSRDPCAHQEELRARWRALLAHALAACRRAALRTVRRQLRGQHAASTPERARLHQFLARELANVRSSQLHLLCDRFQLCFNDLL